MKAYLILEDGTIFEGEGAGARRNVISEIVFNTSMTGYLEVLTDPSYAGQVVCMTYPLIGNYGVTPDMESSRSWVDGYIVSELSRTPSNFRSQGSLTEFLEKQNIPCICGVDTRALTKRLRDCGTMNGMLAMGERPDCRQVQEQIAAYRTGDVVSRVTSQAKKIYPGNGKRIALLDFGEKENITRSLLERDCEVRVYPADTKAEEILAGAPDGIMLSNGPGDPKDCGEILPEIRALYDSGVPIFAICLGHQLMALATGCDTKRMKYGHRGGNHPVRDLETGRIYITSQNHGYMVDTQTLDASLCEPAFVNVNDGTNEGLRYKQQPVFTVQFHPEAAPGPIDSAFLFDRFMGMMDAG